MTTDHGVDVLLRRATDDLRPDVDQLVAAGLTRGRARRRRARIGTAVAAVAVFGVLGATAAVVPHLGGDADAEDAVATQAPSPTPPALSAPHLSQPSGPTSAAADIPALVATVAPGHDVGAALTQAPYPFVDEGGEKVVHFRVDGMLTTVVIGRASASLAYDCTDELAVACQTLGDGTVVQVSAPATGDGVTMQSALALGQTWMVSVLSYNGAEGKEVAPVQEQPALSEGELVAIATSGVWFG